MMKNAFLISIAALFYGCSALSYSAPEKILVSKHKDDLVSVDATVNLARAAYIRGCTEEQKESGQKVSFSRCLERAQVFIKDDVIYIIDQ